MRILKAETHKRMAWKNGGGETIELAVHPEGAGLSDFDWRVSMARVAGDGPFSVFESVDRTLVLLEGEEIVLDIAGLGARALTVDSDPLRFPADAPTGARLAKGAILDLNVMTRRGRCKHRVRRVALGAARAIRPAARWTLLLPQGPAEVAAADGARHLLSARDALVLEAGEPAVTLWAPAPQTALLVEIDAPIPA